MSEPTRMEFAASLRERIRGHKPCGGYGHMLRDGKLETCECRAEAEYEFRLSRSGMPRNFARKDFSDFAQKDSPALARIQEYLAAAEEHRRTGTGLYLHGPSYTGKSLLACSLLKGLMRAGWDCKYLSFDGILDDRDAGVKSSMESEWDFVALDNVGKVLDRLTNFRETVLTAGTTHGAVEYLETLIARRVNACRPLIVLGAVSITEVNARFPALAGTLIGSFIPVNCEDSGFKRRRLELMLEVDTNG